MTRPETIRQMYPEGTKVRMVHCNDPYHPIPSGTCGTVDFVDDVGTVFVSWENGSGLGVCLEEDTIEKI